MKPGIKWNNREAARILLQFEFSFCESNNVFFIFVFYDILFIIFIVLLLL